MDGPWVGSGRVGSQNFDPRAAVLEIHAKTVQDVEIGFAPCDTPVWCLRIARAKCRGYFVVIGLWVSPPNKCVKKEYSAYQQQTFDQ